MIDDQALAEWLTAVPTDLEVRFRTGPYRPEFSQADLVGLVTPTVGPGLIEDAAWDVEGFQVEIVGRDRDRAKLKSSAFQIDRAIVLGDYPAALWGTWVRVAYRSGSAPSSQQLDEHQRQSFVCTYLAEVSL